MSKMMKTLREERETVMQLKGLAPDNKIPKGLLAGGTEAIQSALD
jgi:serine/threonine-protein phosphatase 2B catalytic subunit